jgi:hypothetical protein
MTATNRPENQLPEERQGAMRMLLGPGALDAVNLANAGPKEEVSDPLSFLSVMGKSALHAGVQEPIRAVAQLFGQKGPDWVEMKEADFGSSAWFAQTLGAGGGMVAPFLLTSKLNSVAGNALNRGLTRLETLPATSGMAHTLRIGLNHLPKGPVAKGALDGAVFGMAFTPSYDPEKNFFEQRLYNGIAGGLTFGVQAKLTHSVLGRYQSHLAATGQEMTRPFLTQMGANAIGGFGAGIVSADAHSLLYEHKFATWEDRAKSAAAFVVTGIGLDGARAAGNRFRAHQQASMSPEVISRTEAVVESASKLEAPRAAEHGTQIKDLVQRVNSRRTEIGDPAQITKTLDAVQTVLTSPHLEVPLTPEMRVAVAKQMLYLAAEPLRVDQGQLSRTCGLAGVEQMAWRNAPGTQAQAIAKLLTEGRVQFGNPPVEVNLSREFLKSIDPKFERLLEPKRGSEELASLQQAAEPGAIPLIDSQRSYVSYLSQLLTGNLLGSMRPEGERTLYVVGKADRAIPLDSGERQIHLDGPRARQVATTDGTVRIGPGMESRDVQPLFTLLTGKPVKANFVFLNTAEQLNSTQGTRILEPRQFDAQLRLADRPVLIEINSGLLTGSGHDAASGMPQRHLVIVRKAIDPQTRRQATRNGENLYEVIDNYGRMQDLTGEKAVTAREIYEASRQRSGSREIGSAFREGTGAERLAALEADKRAVLSSLNRGDTNQLGVYRVLERLLVESGYKDRGWEIFPTEQHSPADKVGADFLLINKNTGDMHLLDATGNNNKNAPLIRRSGVIFFDKAWFDPLGVLLPNSEIAPGRRGGRDTFEIDVRQVLHDTAGSGRRSPLNINEPFPEFRKIGNAETLEDITTFVQHLRRKATGSPDKVLLDDYAKTLEQGASSWQNRNVNAQRNEAFERTLNHSIQQAMLRWILEGGPRADYSARKPSRSESVQLIGDKHAPFDIGAKEVWFTERPGQTTDPGTIVQGGKISSILEAQRLELLSLLSAPKVEVAQRNLERASEGVRERAEADLQLAQRGQKLRERIEKRGHRVEDVIRALTNWQHVIVRGGASGERDPLIIFDALGQMNKKSPDALLGIEPAPKPKRAAKTEAPPVIPEEFVAGTREVVRELGAEHVIGKENRLTILEDFVSQDGWSAKRAAEFQKLVNDYRADDPAAIARVEAIFSEAQK